MSQWMKQWRKTQFVVQVEKKKKKKPSVLKKENSFFV